MSEHDSWIAVQGVGATELLNELGLDETGATEIAALAARPYAWGVTSKGWIMIYARFNGLAHIDNIRALSRHGMVIACDFQDQVEGNTGLIIAASDGEELWKIGVSENEVSTSGTPPPEFEFDRDYHAAEVARDPTVAWMYDLPIDLGKEFTGFRHDEDETTFRGLRPRTGSDWHHNLKMGSHPGHKNNPEYIRDHAKEFWWTITKGAVFIILWLVVVYFLKKGEVR